MLITLLFDELFSAISIACDATALDDTRPESTIASSATLTLISSVGNSACSWRWSDGVGG